MSGSHGILERHVCEIARACARPASSLELLESASHRLRRIVNFDGATWFGTDPATVLPTAPARIENVEAGHCGSYWEREFLVEDALLFRDLARAPQPAATLYICTGGHPARSARYRDFLKPQGYGDELRAAFRLTGSTWGVIDLFRDRARAPFSPRDVDIVLAAGPVIAKALRALSLSTASLPPGQTQLPAFDGPGTALFDPAGTLCSLDAQAERAFTELAGPHWNTGSPPLMAAVSAVIARARAVADGRDRGPAAARLRAPSGRWLVVHASCLRDPDGRSAATAVVIEPAKSASIAPIIIEAYGLTPREQQVTQSVARGMTNAEIATWLHLSAHTVRDHLKAIFAKLSVSSRGELTARLFADHYEPPLHEPGSAVAQVEV